MRVIINIAGKDVCTAEIWDEKVPFLAKAFREALPVMSIAQHGKIVGDLLFFSMPMVLPPENASPLQDICRDRRRTNGTAAGSVCFYNPRQQVCIYYGDDVADEPFDLSYIGEIVDGEKDMYIAASRCWTSPGEVITMRLA